MPPKFEIHLKGVLITCVGILASSLGVFVSILSVIVSPLFSLFSPPKPIFIGEGKGGPVSRLQYPPQKIRIRHIRRSSYDQHSSHSSNTLSSNSTTRSVRSNATVGNESQRSPSPDRTRHRNDTSNAPESLIPSRPSTPRLISGPPSLPQPGSPRTSPQTHLGMRKRSTLRDETAPVEVNPTIGNDKLDLDNSSHEQEPPHPAEIIVSPPTPSSSVFLHSAPGPSEGRFGYVSTAGKPAARFVKSHSKRHSLSAACPRKRRSGKRSPNPSTPNSASPVTTPVAESKWRIATRTSQRKKRRSLRIDPPPRGAASPVSVEGGDDMGSKVIYEEPVNITRPPVLQLSPAPARQGPVRTRPYEAPYFFPTPGSPEAIGYVDKIREDRRSVFVQPDAMFVRKKRSFTMSSLEKGGTMGTPKLRSEGSRDQIIEDSGRKRPKSSGKGSGDGNHEPPSSTPAHEFGVQAGAPTKLRKASAPAQLPPLTNTVPTPTTPPRPQAQRQGTLGIMRMLGKH